MKAEDRKALTSYVNQVNSYFEMDGQPLPPDVESIGAWIVTRLPTIIELMDEGTSPRDCAHYIADAATRRSVG